MCDRLRSMRDRHVIIAATLFALTWVVAPVPRAHAGETTTVAAPTHIGSTACRACHPKQFEQWQGSHHDLAMQPANEATVLANFDDKHHEENGIKTHFFRRGPKFYARTEGPDGKDADFEITYVFGIDPLQQYLIAFPGGRYQVLGSSWDARPKEAGGQRWYSNYPGETIHFDDVLHWTQQSQNWNHMCAECHSTNLRKGYDASSDSFKTEWSEIDVACEACHGPGSAHQKQASQAASGKQPNEASGLNIDFPSVGLASWLIDPRTSMPMRNPPRTEHTEVELCARCHSRRSALVEAPEVGRPIQDTHRVSTLDGAIYHPDGQPRPEEESYVYGSFVQSAMYGAGVTCSDCHDPHTATLRASGNDLCSRCHTKATYDSPKHHQHKAGSTGAQCVECHMPNTTYMGVDERRDHGLRIPRPDLSEALGTPNACNGCHSSMTSSWAAHKVKTWFPNGRHTTRHWGEAIHAGQWTAADAERLLVGLLATPSTPPIVRATAIGLLPRFASQNSLPAFPLAINDESALVRTSALEAIGNFPEELRLEWAANLLNDPVRSVRQEAVRALASVPRGQLKGAIAKNFDNQLAEYRAAQLRDGSRPEPYMRLAELALAENDLDLAESEYRRALERNSSFIPAFINLADLHRVRGADEEAERVLRQALAKSGDQPDVRHALGLTLIRLSRVQEATTELERASKGRPELPRYAYVFAAALHQQGESNRARSVLREALALHPGDRDLQSFMMSLAREK
ncbi:MAG: HEAT repeat domain-containing protein [Myxococcota bacterium]|nr:HEAT repeat domain-containing protein [Myxococcota bacterium]